MTIFDSGNTYGMAELSKIKVELNLFSLVGQKVNNAECSCITVQLHTNNHIGLDDERKQTRCGSVVMPLKILSHLSLSRSCLPWLRPLPALPPPPRPNCECGGDGVLLTVLRPPRWLQTENINNCFVTVVTIVLKPPTPTCRTPECAALETRSRRSCSGSFSSNFLQEQYRI